MYRGYLGGETNREGTLLKQKSGENFNSQSEEFNGLKDMCKASESKYGRHKREAGRRDRGTSGTIFHGRDLWLVILAGSLNETDGFEGICEEGSFQELLELRQG